MVRYAMERFLYRLSISKYQDIFILKGAMLLEIYLNTSIRTTKDIDFLMFGYFDTGAVKQMITEVCEILLDDGLRFDIEGIAVTEAGADRPYPGFGVSVPARLGAASVNFAVDIAFGEAVTPRAIRVKYPSLLGYPQPEVRVYPLETIVAEKFQAMVLFGVGNRRMKDYYDLWAIAQNCELDGALLTLALSATFARRATKLPEKIPQGLTESFYANKQKKQNWQAFLKTYSLRKSLSLEAICQNVAALVMPAVEICIAGEECNLVWKSAEWRSGDDSADNFSEPENTE